jgi:hypothetical protein
MRTLGEIEEAAMSGEMPTHEECYWAMLALRALVVFDGMSFRSLLDESVSRTPQREYEEYFNRTKRAYATDPKQYVGKNNDPANPEMQERRKVALKIFNKIATEALAGGEGE